MDLPFSAEQFFEVFHRYNDGVWPAQILLTGIGLVAAFLAFRPRPGSDRFVAGTLALLWAWMGVAYHIRFFQAINPAALAFGLLFLFQSILFLWYGILRSDLRFKAPRSVAGIIGGSLIVFAFVAYPLLARSFGHIYPAAPTFGLPCPTTIATLGLILWLVPPVPWPLVVIPLLWSAVGASAAVILGVREDYALGLAGVLTAIVFLTGRRAPSPPP
jgi:hypothetical protein